MAPRRSLPARRHNVSWKRTVSQLLRRSAALVRAAKADRNATQDGILPARFRAFALNVQHLTACDADLVDDIMSAKRGRGGAPAYAATQAAIDARHERLMTLIAPLVADALDAKGVKNTPLWAIQYVLSDPAATFEALA